MQKGKGHIQAWQIYRLAKLLTDMWTYFISCMLLALCGSAVGNTSATHKNWSLAYGTCHCFSCGTFHHETAKLATDSYLWLMLHDRKSLLRKSLLEEISFIWVEPICIQDVLIFICVFSQVYLSVFGYLFLFMHSNLSSSLWLNCKISIYIYILTPWYRHWLT